MLIGIEKLEKAKLYNLITEEGRKFQLCFEGFELENKLENGVEFAVFSDPVSQEFYGFDIDAPRRIIIEFA